MEMEKENPETNERYTWIDGESLQELIEPERIKQIETKFEKRNLSSAKVAPNTPLTRVFSLDIADEDGDEGCLICHL
jgi:hypothetical protein